MTSWENLDYALIEPNRVVEVYLVHLESVGDGYATLTFQDGTVYGYDQSGRAYDGMYTSVVSLGNIDVTVQVTMKAGVPPLAGGESKPFDWC